MTKDELKQLLIDTDYAVLPDVALDNKDEFIAFRKAVRIALIHGAPTGVGEIPEPQWTVPTVE